MWMRLCADCKALLRNYGSAIVSIAGAVGSGRASRSGLRMPKVIEFYRPSNFRKDAKITPQERGKVIEFRAPPKKSA
jgi:hypothetical protein